MTDPGPHKPCFQAHHVSLSELLSMARYYGVDLKSREYWLLAAVKAAVLAPVVEPWIQQEEAGQPVFKHTGSHKTSSQHPLDTAFLRLIQQMRTSGPPPDNLSRCVMIVKGEDGSLSAYDASTGQHCDVDQPPERLVLPCSEDQLPKYTKDVEDEWLSSARSVGPGNSSADAEVSTSGPPPYTGRQPRASEKPRHSVRIQTTQQQTATAKAPSRKPRLKDVTHLTFHTWWLEDHESNDLTFRDNGESVGGGIAPRHLSLSLCLATGKFDVTIRGRPPKEQVLKLHNISAVTTAQGMPVRAWDLSVGARLSILNNAVSLRACDVPTGMWLASLAEKVLAIKRAALRELRKYSQQPLPRGLSHVRGEGGGRFLHSYTPSITQQRQGGVNVQAAAEQVEWVCTFLDKFRPSSSAKYRKSLRALRDHTTRSRVYPYQSSPPSALQRVAEEAAEAAELETDGTNAGGSSKRGGSLNNRSCRAGVERVTSRSSKRAFKGGESGAVDDAAHVDTETLSAWPGSHVQLNTLPLSLTCPALVPAKGKDVWRTTTVA